MLEVSVAVASTINITLLSYGLYQCTFNVANGLCVFSDAGLFLITFVIQALSYNLRKIQESNRNG